MKRLAIALAVLSASAGLADASARRHDAPNFVHALDRNGTMSAGWVDALPALASACKMHVDNRELNDKLVGLSQDTGNDSYTWNLYSTLYRIEERRDRNAFARAWNARFDGRQQEACNVAEALWGEDGHQFPGVLKHDLVNDGSVIPPGTVPNNCK